MKKLKIHFAIKCDTNRQLRDCRKRLIDMGYIDDKVWNDFCENNKWRRNKKYILIFANYEFIMANHDGLLKTIHYNDFIGKQQKLKIPPHWYAIIVLSIAIAFLIGNAINTHNKIKDIERYVYPVIFID